MKNDSAGESERMRKEKMHRKWAAGLDGNFRSALMGSVR